MGFPLEWTAAATALAAGTAAIWSFGEAVSALRAKSRLRDKMTSRLEHDGMLRVLRAHALQNHLSPAEFAELQEVLARMADDLPERDQRLVKRSLQQPSKAGERRYITEMLTAA